MRSFNPTKNAIITMFHLKSKWLVLLAGAIIAATPALAQDKALIDILIKKGILNEQEAKEITKELAKEDASTEVSTSGSKFLKKLTLSGRIQAQFNDISASVDGAAVQPAAIQHFLLRRIYFGFKAEMGEGWSGNVNYDFANSSFDAAFIQWKQSDQLILDIGFRKAPIGLEEWETSSGSLKAIERSPVTRYFVESNNGRRLGAGSYRQGVFLGGSQDGFSYNVAITNPERDEFSSLNGNSDPGVQSAGNSANNNFAYWANAGYKGKLSNGNYHFGASVGYLPDQGGTALGKGDNLTVYSVYGVLAPGPFELGAEYWYGHNEHGVSATQDANPWGYWVQPSYKFTAKLEGVVRYSYVDSDHRGVNIADGTRLSPSGGTMNTMNEWYIGGNYYFRGNDVKLQLGYIFTESNDTVTGAFAHAKAEGLRSQMQLNF